MKRLKIFNKISLGLGLLLLAYGFLNKRIPIYFFWESTLIGWQFILFGLSALFIFWIKKRKVNNKKTIWLKLGLGYIFFLLLVQTSSLIIIPFTDAYKLAKNTLLNNEVLKSEIGEIKGFGWISTGGVSVQTDSNGKKGNAYVNLILKGDKAYKNVTVFAIKDYGKDWEVTRFE